MTVSQPVAQATARLMGRIESAQRDLEAAEEEFAAAAGLRLPIAFQDSMTFPYRAAAGGGPEDASGSKQVMDAVIEAEFALSALAAACLGILPPDYARRRILWTRLHIGFLTPEGTEASQAGGDPLKASWEGR
jgi:hypothetical protein